jgi:ABC-type polysaccharide/polyol phosphate export permease
MWHNLGQLTRYRGLIQSLVVRDLKARYRGSVLGFFWSFVNPLLLLSIYTFVFKYVLRHDDPVTDPYSVFMFCGLLPWTWFSASLTESTGSLIAGGNLIKKVLFPAEVLPIVSVLSNMAHFFLGMPILLAFMIAKGHYPDLADLPWLPFVILVQLVFTIGLALILSAISVHFRDVRDLLANILTLWFFATPIIYRYSTDGVQQFRWLFKFNPFFHLVVAYQELLFFPGPLGHKQSLLILAAASVALFLAGYWLFDRLRDSFAESV